MGKPQPLSEEAKNRHEWAKNLTQTKKLQKQYGRKNVKVHEDNSGSVTDPLKEQKIEAVKRRTHKWTMEYKDKNKSGNIRTINPLIQKIANKDKKV